MHNLCWILNQSKPKKSKSLESKIFGYQLWLHPYTPHIYLNMQKCQRVDSFDKNISARQNYYKATKFQLQWWSVLVSAFSDCSMNKCGQPSHNNRNGRIQDAEFTYPFAFTRNDIKLLFFLRSSKDAPLTRKNAARLNRRLNRFSHAPAIKGEISELKYT